MSSKTREPLSVRLYKALQPRRAVLLAVTLGILALLAAGMLRIRVSENVMALLPDDTEGVASDFELLRRAPFLHKVLVTLSAEDDEAAARLTETARGFSAALASDPATGLFTRVEHGPPAEAGSGIIAALLANQPNHATDESLRALEDRLGREAVRTSLREDWALMTGPEAWAMKELVRLDPLGFRASALQGLAAVNLLPGVRLRDGVFVSADGRHALLVAETPVDITDSAGSERLLEAFWAIAYKSLPQGIRAEIVSGHVYSAANAAAIKSDLGLIMVVSSVFLAAIFLLFLRSLQAGWVLLLPYGSLCAGSVAVFLLYPDVSGITLGFGGVLLGISVDYGLHVFIALKQGGESRVSLLGKVSRPVTLGAATTVAAFCVLLISDLPAQRQLAVFAIAGLTMALVQALVVLPHLVSPSPIKCIRLPDFTRLANRFRPAIIVLWIGLLVLGAWGARHIGFNGNMRALGLASAEIDAAEARVRETWGDVRGRALVLVQGESLQKALEANDRLYVGLREGLGANEVVSLAALLPAEATQARSRDHWQAFWAERGPQVLSTIEEEGAALGFSPSAFEPFARLVSTRPAPLTDDSLRAAGLGRMIEGLLLPPSAPGEPWGVLSLVPDTDKAAALVADATDGTARFVSQGRFGDMVSQALHHDFTKFLALALLAVGLIIYVGQRSLRRTLLALAPIGTGIAGLFAFMGLTGMSFNLYNLAAVILIIGLGEDYGIFMLERLDHLEDRSAEHSVLVSGLTTLAGFGSLALASHPALNSIGLTALVGMVGTLPGALLLVPALARSKHD